MILGIDVSTYLEELEHGARYFDGDVQIDPLDAFYANGVNFLRIRLWNHPFGEAGEPYLAGSCDMEHYLRLASLAKGKGYRLLLDFHYSDFWADPGKQITPKAWQNYTIDQLVEAVYAFTKECLTAAAAQGVPPEMVQVGNEVSNGMLWPYGSVRHSCEGLCGLLKEGVRAVREHAPDAEIMIHVALGGQAEESERFFDAMAEYGVEYDLIGQSYYPEWHGTLEELEANANALVAKYKKPLIVVEYRDHYLAIDRIVRSLPDGLGRGTFIWEATSPHWGKLFDDSGAATEAIKAYRRY